jgi:hypothetical protein
MRLLPLLACATGLALGSVRAAGQDAPPGASAPYPDIRPGSRVRIIAPGVADRRYAGTVVERHGDTLVIARGPDSHVRAPITALSLLEVSRGRSRAQGAKHGLVAGALGAAGVGALMAAAYCSDENFECPQGVIAASAYLSLGGAFWGAVIGAAVSRERWETRIRTAGVSFPPVPRGVGVALALRY